MSRRDILIPFIVLVVLLPFLLNSDQVISSWFYDKDRGFSHSPWKSWVFQGGSFLGLALPIGSLIVWVGSFVFPSWKHFRRVFFYSFLCMTIGGGLIVNVIFKDHWGRPRPIQTEEFGGNLSYRPFYAPNFNSFVKAKSFPCGHASVGFWGFSFYYILKRSRYRYIGFLLGLLGGSLLGYVRISQGGHFFSDVFFSGWIMWYTCGIIFSFIEKYPYVLWEESSKRSL